MINPWIQMSIDFANQRNYLDELFEVYPTIPEREYARLIQ